MKKATLFSNSPNSSKTYTINVQRDDILRDFSFRIGYSITAIVANAARACTVEGCLHNSTWHISCFQELLVHHFTRFCIHFLEYSKRFIFANPILLHITVHSSQDISSTHVLLVKVNVSCQLKKMMD